MKTANVELSAQQIGLILRLIYERNPMNFMDPNEQEVMEQMEKVFEGLEFGIYHD